MEDEKEPKHLWSTLLKESSKRFKAPEATCIFLGDIDVGKNTLLSKIVSSSAYEDDGNGRYTKEIISYSFIDVDEGLLDSDSLSRINMWSISNRTFESSIDLIAKSDKAHRLLFMIGVDISKPDGCVNGLKKWLRKVRKFAAQRTSHTAGNDSGLKWSEMGVDVIIVACKSDLLKVDDAVSLKRAKAIQGQLRAIGLLIGAAVVYVSAMTDVNTARLRKYIIHKMYPEAVGEEGGIENTKRVLPHIIMKDGMSSAFIPHGTDSTELILIATGFAVSSTDDKETVSLLDSPLSNEEEEDSPTAGTSDSAQNSANLAGLELEDEEEWLTGLQTFISDVTSSGAVPLSTPSSGPSLSVVTDAAGGEQTVKSSTRRNFRAPVAAQGKQDVDDFFQKLLIGDGTGAVKK